MYLALAAPPPCLPKAALDAALLARCHAAAALLPLPACLHVPSKVLTSTPQRDLGLVAVGPPRAPPPGPQSRRRPPCPPATRLLSRHPVSRRASSSLADSQDLTAAVYMPPTRSRPRMHQAAPATTSPAAPTTSATTTAGQDPPSPAQKETIVTAPPSDSTPATSPTFHVTTKPPPRKVLRLKCPICNEYPDGFRSEHELRRHTNRVHRKTRKVWVTIDTSADKTFLANCKACQTGKRYNECYNAASHLRRMHFHPHKRGERKMTAAEARRGGKPGDLDPPMEVLKAHWLREVDEIIGEDGVAIVDDVSPTVSAPKPQQPPAQPPQLKTTTTTTTTTTDGKAPPTPTTPSTRSMAIDSIVDKMDAS